MLVVAAAIVPVSGVFTLSKIFFVRDLTFVFWPRYRWLRQSLRAGEWPLWDRFAGAGQSVVADALHQIFLIPTLAIRVLAPEVVGFNVWVALPFPIAALGAYRFFVRRVSPSSAALGAIVFTLSGPMLSTGNFPNLSWSAAFMPWVLLAVDRCWTGDLRRAVVLAVAFALQILSGEPVTMTATAALVVAFAAVAAPPDAAAAMPDRMRSRASFVGLVFLGLVLGGLLAAAQLFPLLFAGASSARGALKIDNFWSIHPLGLLEAIAPHLFGDYFQGFLSSYPWMAPLNSDRDPFYYSLYVGIAALMLALMGGLMTPDRRSARFWLIAGILSALAALGSYTPLYPAVQQLLPALRAFRFPSKYLLVTAIALAWLVAAGWEALAVTGFAATEPRQRLAKRLVVSLALGCAIAAYGLLVCALFLPDVAARSFFELARIARLPDPVAGAVFLLREVPPQAARLLLLALATAGMLWVIGRRRPEARIARPVLYGLVVIDLLATNGRLNPTMDAQWLREPSWLEATRAHAEARVYFGGRLRGRVEPEDRDGPQSWKIPAEFSAIEGRTVLNNELAMVPAAWHVREVVSFDLLSLWPNEYEMMVSRFEKASREERLRFLARTGVRYCVLPDPPPSADAIATLPYFDGMALYECARPMPEAFIVEEALVEPEVRRQIDRMFDAAHNPATSVLLQKGPPPPAGVPGKEGPASAKILDVSHSFVTVEATTGATGGYLTLLDSFDPWWTVEVDGQRAQLLRANGLFRAVRLTTGRHVVRFAYRPLPFFIGLGVTLVTGAALVAACLVRRKIRRPLEDLRVPSLAARPADDSRLAPSPRAAIEI